jgi:arginyl-tRNA--protein-N-Asp/Glu arginylyltransferase
LAAYIILDHIERARAELPFVYLGYWVQGSPKMDYKALISRWKCLNPPAGAPCSQ